MSGKKTVQTHDTTNDKQPVPVITVALRPIIPVFLAILVAFILLTLTTFSFPMSSLYFLWTSQANGLRFGMWGWCLDGYDVCSAPMQMAYIWDPQIATHVMKAHVLIPIAAVLCFLTMISLIPVALQRTERTDKVFSLMAILSFLVSLIAFTFMITIWSIAKDRFQKAGFEARFGPLPWMSLSATLMLLIVTLHSGCGTLSRSRRGPHPSQPERY